MKLHEHSRILFFKMILPCNEWKGIESCTMLLEQIKGFYHGITKIFWLVVIPCLAGILKDIYIVVHVRIDCGI